MDKQTKLFVTINGETQEVMLSSMSKQTEPLFVFSEYGYCQIELQTTQPQAFLEVESMTQEGVIKVTPSTPFMLSQPEKPEEGYVPGNFLLSYVEGNKRVEYFFTVSPQSLSEASLKTMCQLLEERAHGVTRNRYSHQFVVYEEQTTYHEFDLLGYLFRHFDELMNSLNQVLACPIEDLTQRYQLTRQSKKQDLKSLRWNETKGQRQTTDEAQSLYYEKRHQVTYNTVENRSLKHMIFQISTQLLRLNKGYRLTQQALIQQQQDLIAKIETLTQHKTTVTERNHLKKTKVLVSQEIYVRKEELATLTKKLETHQQQCRQLQRMIGRLNAILTDSWMAELPMAFNGRLSQRFFKAPGYSFIHSVYQEVMNLNQSRQKLPTFPLHQTSRLFEYYNLFLVVELLQQQGFVWKSGWLKDFNPSHYQPRSLEVGEELWFENSQGNRIRLSYDKFLKTSSEAKLGSKAQMVSVNSASRRPDLLIELFHQQTFLSAMIIEVKYRKLYSIYQNIHETDAMKQLMDYRALNYYDPTCRPMLRQQAVDTILTVYPNHEGSRHIQDEVYGFDFVPLSPTGFDESVEGVAIIKQSLSDFISRYLN